MAIESLAELACFAPDVYGFRFQNHVAMFIVTGEGVILVDAIGQANPRTPFMIKEAIRSVTEQPVKYFVYSHSAFDHSTGGAAFADTAAFVGHQNAVARISAAHDPTTPVPETTLDTKLALSLGGKRIDLYSADLSAGDDYVIVHDPQSRVVMTVDFVQPRNVPFRTLIGHPDAIVAKLQWIYDTLDFDVLVSGHASPAMTGGKEDVLQQRQYYLDLSDAIASTGATDSSAGAVAAIRSKLAAKYGQWRRFDEFLALNVEGMIRWRSEDPPTRH